LELESGSLKDDKRRPVHNNFIRKNAKNNGPKGGNPQNKRPKNDIFRDGTFKDVVLFHNGRGSNIPPYDDLEWGCPEREIFSMIRILDLELKRKGKFSLEKILMPYTYMP
jgi:hypothetical protein